MSLREAINAKCRECVYDPYAPGSWREQVEACGCPNCPLYPVRPRPRRRKVLPTDTSGEMGTTAGS